jgi:hypothetical protein
MDPTLRRIAAPLEGHNCLCNAAEFAGSEQQLEFVTSHLQLFDQRNVGATFVHAHKLARAGVHMPDSCLAPPRCPGGAAMHRSAFNPGTPSIVLGQSWTSPEAPDGAEALPDIF